MRVSLLTLTLCAVGLCGCGGSSAATVPASEAVTIGGSGGAAVARVPRAGSSSVEEKAGSGGSGSADPCQIGDTRACLDDAGTVSRQYCQNTNSWLACTHVASGAGGGSAGSYSEMVGASSSGGPPEVTCSNLSPSTLGKCSYSARACGDSNGPVSTGYETADGSVFQCATPVDCAAAFLDLYKYCTDSNGVGGAGGTGGQAAGGAPSAPCTGGGGRFCDCPKDEKGGKHLGSQVCDGAQWGACQCNPACLVSGDLCCLDTKTTATNQMPAGVNCLASEACPNPGESGFLPTDKLWCTPAGKPICVFKKDSYGDPIVECL